MIWQPYVCPHGRSLDCSICAQVRLRAADRSGEWLLVMAGVLGVVGAAILGYLVVAGWLR